MLVFLFFLLGCVDADAPIDATSTVEFVLEVPKGATANGLGETMVQNGMIGSGLQWKLFLREQDVSCLKAGKFRLKRSMSLRQVAETLCGPPIPDDQPFTVIEGWRIRDIDAALAAKGWIHAGDYADLAESKRVDMPFDVPSPTLEGYLYPETYMVTPDRFSTERFIERQLTLFKERFLGPNESRLGPRGLNAIVVMASMLEREEPRPQNRPTVAGILWKRIDHGWNLGVDATSRYTLAEWNDRDAFLVHLRDPAEPYNTRLRSGLPPTAIGNPALPSLEAALSPTDSEWWYYLHDGQGQFHGARDAAGHDANRRQFGIW